uniref:E3 ubiquitin/ISG15 ligase TRIM25-like n=1 Tax=Scleropages formosus TaxID=113540 RepID=A0A8C9S7H8_SCLFO
MAEASISVGQDQFSCSICLDLLKVPVTIPCGHSYCMDCIKGCWDQEDQVGVYRCPQCRHTFTPRPVLGRNTMLAEVVEKVKKSGLQAAPPAPFSSGPGDVECDVCIGRKKKAVKSCLVCLASYCRTHLQPHYESAPLRKHKLTDSTGHLQDKICSLHDKVLELYCRTDRQCVCYLCTVDEHRGHNTVSAAAEKNKKQKELWMIQREFQLLMRERERDVQELRQAVDSLARSAQAALEDTESIFSEMIRSIERRRSEVRDLIRAQEKAAIHRAEGLQKQAEQEIAELKRRHSELQKVLHTEDDVHFLKVTWLILQPTRIHTHESGSCCLRSTKCSDLTLAGISVCRFTSVSVSLLDRGNAQGTRRKVLPRRRAALGEQTEASGIRKTPARDTSSAKA